jgi:hypothetical protein
MAHNKRQIKSEMRECKSLNEILDVVNSYYDMDSNLGIMSKGLVVEKILVLVDQLRIPDRK